MRKEENSFFIWIFLSHSNLWLLSSFFIILCMALHFEFNNWCILTILTSKLCVNTSWNIIVFYLRQTEYSIEWHNPQLMIEMFLLALFGLVLSHVCIASSFVYLALSLVFYSYICCLSAALFFSSRIPSLVFMPLYFVCMALTFVYLVLSLVCLVISVFFCLVFLFVSMVLFWLFAGSFSCLPMSVCMVLPLGCMALFLICMIIYLACMVVFPVRFFLLVVCMVLSLLLVWFSLFLFLFGSLVVYL